MTVVVGLEGGDQHLGFGKGVELGHVQQLASRLHLSISNAAIGVR